jgi:transcriptional regulator GlxA family with amidase domain
MSKEIVDEFLPGFVSEDMAKQALDIKFHWVTEHGQDGVLTAGATVKATVSGAHRHTTYFGVLISLQDDFKSCPQLDVALMGAHELKYTMTQGEIDFIKKTEQGCAAFMFICGGLFSGLQAGLLKGKTATGPRIMLDMLRREHPEVQWVEKRWANDGKIWTSGALLNGTDMTRAFALQTWGGEGSLAEFGMQLGGYPDRDVDYADVSHKL